VLEDALAAVSILVLTKAPGYGRMYLRSRWGLEGDSKHFGVIGAEACR